MASRYGNRNFERRGNDRSEFGQGYRRGGRDDIERSGGRGWRTGSGGFGQEDDREQYFGGGSQSFGGGYVGGSSEGDFGSYPRHFEEGSSSYDRTRQPDLGSHRDRDYEDRYDDWRRERNVSGGYSGRSGYGGANYGRSRYESRFPESETGYSSRGEYEGEERGWLDRASDEVSSWFGDEEAERRREMDARRYGQHRGRGPRNYTRSDERIKEDVNDRLTDYAYLDASDIEVEVSSGEVILSGEVSSRYDKRLAEDLAEDVSGVRNVENRIRVNANFGRTGESGWSYSDTAGHTESGGVSTTAGSTGTSGKTGSTTTGSTTPAGKSKSASGSR